MTSDAYLKGPYARIVIPDERGGYYSEILEFPGCFAQGDTVEEAFRNLEEAAKSWLEVAVANGQEIPQPSTNRGFSGRVALRLPRGLHKQAAKAAEREGTSLNQFLLTAIASRVGSEDLYTRIVNRLESRLIATASNLTQMFAYNVRNAGQQSFTVLNPKLLRGESADTSEAVRV